MLAISDDFLRCEHGYEDYSDCPLCSRAIPAWSGDTFDQDRIDAVDEFFGDADVSAEDKAALLSAL